MSRRAAADAVAVTPDLLRRMRLPPPDSAGDKEERGRVLVVAGAVEMPGAAVLAGTASLRAGAGKLRIATCASVAPSIGVAVPEALAMRLPETPGGAIAPEAADRVVAAAEQSQALLLGPGMVDREATASLAAAVVARLHSPAIVLDAGALEALARDHRLLSRLEDRAVVTPHAGEMARLIGRAKEEVQADALAVAHEAAQRFRTVVMLKGAETWIVAPDGRAFCYRDGCVGLATSGSGDTLAGLLAGLLARGTDTAEAAAWAAWLHGAAGNRLARRHGAVGFLARELLDEIPALMQELA